MTRPGRTREQVGLRSFVRPGFLGRTIESAGYGLDVSTPGTRLVSDAHGRAQVRRLAELIQHEVGDVSA
jgi:hypothetical protein